MPRTNLGQLLGNVGESAHTPVPNGQPPRPSRPDDDVATTDKTAVSPRRSRASEGGARYLRFVRKDTRLREDQLAALTAQARRLSRRRLNSNERITENSLIRIAVDLLLERIASATGSDEQSILESLRK